MTQHNVQHFRVTTSKSKTVMRLAPNGMTVGTAVMTMEGERYVEDLKPGDRVLTKDYGAQQIKCTGFRDVDLKLSPNRAPVLIHAGSFGASLPARPIFLAPDQRVTLRHRMFEMFFGSREVLIAAQDLVGLKNVTRVEGLSSITYVSLAFARHQILYCGNLAVDLGFFGNGNTRPCLSQADARVALGVLTGKPLAANNTQDALH